VNVIISGWGNYAINTESLSENVTVYRPVPMPIPTAAIDYAGEKLTGLATGSYRFKHEGEPDFGGAHAVTDGTYNLADKGAWMDGQKLYIKREAEGNTVDSAVQELTIPARPLAPDLDDIDITPAGSDPDGKIVMEISPTIGVVWEYNRYADQSNTWTEFDENNTADDLHWGLYYVREKARNGATAANSNFAGYRTSVYVPAAEDYIFAPVYEGYDGTEAAHAAMDITMGDSEISSVVLEGTNAATYFDLDEDEGTWTIKPKTGLPVGRYEATVKITHGESQDTYRAAAFQVYAHAVITSVAAIDIDEDGTTDQIWVEFDHNYPNVAGGDTNTYFQYSQFAITGAAEKVDNDTMGFAVEPTAYGNLYKFNVKPHTWAKASDTVTVTLTLHSGEGAPYAYQASQDGNTLSEEGTIAVKRTITSAAPLVFHSSFPTSAIQFTLSGYDIDVTKLIGYYTGDENEPSIKMQVSATEGGSTASAYVLGVSKVDAAEDTYRVFIYTAAEGAAQVNIADYVDAPSTAVTLTSSDTITFAADGDAYFLNAGGYNYTSDIGAFQILPAIDAGAAVVAPEVVSDPDEL
jgi:hypothetical protein